MAITRTARGTAAADASQLNIPSTGNFQPADGETVIAVISVPQGITLNSIIWTGDSSNFTQDLNISNAGNVRGVVARMKKASWSAGQVRVTLASAAKQAGVASSYTNLTDALNASDTATGSAAPASTTPDITGTPGSGLQVLWVGALCTQGPDGDTAGTWVNPDNAGQRLGSTGGGATGNKTASEGYEIDSTEVTQSLSKTGFTNRQWAAGIANYLELTSDTTTDKTITALARITATQDRTIITKARITAVTDKTITAKARMAIVVDQTILARARITAITDRTITAKGDILKTIDQTITAVANITTIVTTDRTILARARIQVTTDQTTTALARITSVLDRTINSVARIQILSDKTITAVANILITTDRTIPALARITSVLDRTITSVARIQTLNDKTITAIASILLITSKTIPARARITNTTDRTITARGRIAGTIFIGQSVIRVPSIGIRI